MTLLGNGLAVSRSKVLNRPEVLKCTSSNFEF